MTKKAQSRSRKRIRRWILGVVFVAALLLLFLWNMRIDTIHVEGSEFYTEQEIIDYIFEKPIEQNFLYAYLNNRFGEKKEIPFVAGYTVKFNGTKEAAVTVYEKNVIGYIDYMGSHMYFDKDGTVVESSSEIWEGIPLITGLSFDYIILYKPLPVENETAFNQILNLTQLINKYKIHVDKIYFNTKFEATLYIGDVRVMLGDKTDMEDKVAELTGMLPKLAGLSGTLHLEDYDKTAMNPRFSFIKDAEPEETAQADEAPPTEDPAE